MSYGSGHPASAGRQITSRRRPRAATTSGDSVSSRLTIRWWVIAMLRTTEKIRPSVRSATDSRVRPGVQITGTPGRNRESVADLTLGLIFSVVRNIAITHHLIVSRELTESPEVVAARGRRRDVIWRPA